MLSVPHPSGRSSLGGGSGASAAAREAGGVTAAKLPPSRWARRGENNSTPSASIGRQQTMQHGPTQDGAVGGTKAQDAAAAAAAASENDSSPPPAPGSRKRKTSDAQDSGATAAGDGASGGTAAASTTADGNGRRGGGKSNGTNVGGAGKDGAGAQGNDPSDDLALSPPRTKRARTNSEVDRLAKQQQQSSPAPGKSWSSPHPPAAANKTGQADRQASFSSSSPAATYGSTPAKGKDGTVGKEDASVANGGGALTTPRRSGHGDTLAEETRRLEARRRELSARSPYVYGGVGRADPNAGLPKSVRPPPAAFAREGGEVGGGDSKAATPAKPAPKVRAAFLLLLVVLAMSKRSFDDCVVFCWGGNVGGASVVETSNIFVAWLVYFRQ